MTQSARTGGPAAEPPASLYAVTGTSLNTAIGRVAFALGLGGPAMAVDTACSSSLVATHQAVTGLQRGDADLALAGGVNIILSGRLLEYRANAGMLSPDGQCKTFDASANGYVRGEGCGIVVLKRLADAEADGDRIWGGDPGHGTEPGRGEPGAHGSERGGAGAGDRGGARAGRGPAIGHRLPGGARDRHGGGRPDRDRRDGGGLRARARRGAPAAARLGEDQHRPPGIGGRRRGNHQGPCWR